MHKIFEGIEMVAFDIMGVIITESSLVRKGLYPLYKDNFSYEYIKSLYKDIRSDTQGDISIWKGLGVKESDKAREEFLDIYKVDSGFEKLRNCLKEKGINKGIISNMPKEWGEYFVEKLNLNYDFDPIVLSGTIGLKKPNDEIYQRFLEDSGVEGEEIVFIDDKLENLEAAKKFNINTVLFDRGKEQDGFKPDLIIKSFKELI
jgi:putative hydrolase of the HAD superfamily